MFPLRILDVTLTLFSSALGLCKSNLTGSVWISSFRIRLSHWIKANVFVSMKTEKYSNFLYSFFSEKSTENIFEFFTVLHKICKIQ